MIYEPKGKAGEYSPLAINTHVGCAHACTYCYCPSILRTSLKEWSANVRVKPGVLEKVEKAARKYAAKGEQREIMLCFMSDPYQSAEASEVTRNVLLILEKYGLRAHVLTKAGFRARRDFPIFRRNDWKFGSTICFASESLREKWEPRAPSIASRIEAVKEAHAMGIRTWVSMEPVVDPDSAMEAIDMLDGYVDEWKIGKINYVPKIERAIDWRGFVDAVRKRLAGQEYYLKKDLLAAAERHG